MPRQKGKRHPFKPHRALREKSDESLAEVAPVETFKKQEKKDKLDSIWYIASGYLNDVIDLLEDFESCPGWTFKDFAVCWRKKTFSLVNRGRQTFKELLEFCEEIAYLTKRFLLRPHSIKRRIGALYCLYGLYFKHPKRQFFDLRFDLKEYKETLELVQPFRSNVENPDPAFVFRKLEACGAIKHCATSMEMCVEFHNKERELVDLEYGKEKLAKSSTVNEAVPALQLEADHQLMQFYHNMKLKISGNNADTEKALCLVKPEVFSNVIDELSELKKQALDELVIKEPQKIAFANCAQLQRNNRNDNNLSQQFPKSESVSDNIVDESVDISPVEPPIEEAAIISTVNRGKRATKCQTMDEEKQILADKSIDNFMSKTTSLESMFLPKSYLKKRKKAKLNLNDLKAKAGPYKEPLPNAELLLSVPQFDKPTRSRRRTTALQKALKPKRKMIRKCLQYKPDGPKSIKEEVDFIGVTAVPKSATNLVLDREATSNSREMLQMLVKIDCSGVEMHRKLKVKVSCTQWEEMKNDPERMERFKNKIMPLLGISRNVSDDVRILDIVAVPAEDTKRQPTNTNRVVMESIYIKEQRQEECNDDDYNPFSDDEDKKSEDMCNDEYENEKQTDSLDELEDMNAVDEYLSDEEDRNYFRSTYLKERVRRKYHYSDYYFDRERVGVLNNDLIAAKKSPTKVKMVPIQVGTQIKYIPMTSSKSKSSKNFKNKENENGGNSFTSNDDIEFHSFNDYTTTDKPPPNNSRNSLHKNLRKGNPYTIMCVRGSEPETVRLNISQSTRRIRKTSLGTKRRQIEKVMSRRVPQSISPNCPESDLVFFNEVSDDDVEQNFNIEKEDISPDLETKAEACSPFKANTEVNVHPSIEELASDWDDVEDVPSIDGEYNNYEDFPPESDSKNMCTPERTHGHPPDGNALSSQTLHVMPIGNPENSYPTNVFTVAPSMENSNAIYTHVPNPLLMPMVGQPSRGKMVTLQTYDVGEIFKASGYPLSGGIDNITVDNGYIYSTTPLETNISQLNHTTPIVYQEAPPTASCKNICVMPPYPATPSSTTENKFVMNSSQPPSPRKPTCGFLFSSKFKSLKRLSSSRGEASGKPPSSRRIKFFKKGVLRS